MSSTSSTMIELGKKAHKEKQIEILDSREFLTDKGDISIITVRKNDGSSKNYRAFYKRVDFNGRKKKEAYKKINKMLGEG